ncbi:MAG: nucleoside triphosphate pyrophosphatase [Archangium sp.]
MLTLASASPRRRELLGHLGIEFTVAPSDIDEMQKPGEGAHAYVERLAREKSARGSGLVLAADTSVVIDDEVLGKPGTDRTLGAQMLHRLSGRAHEVLTGIALTSNGRTVSRVVSSKVHFRELSASEIAWYVATGEGADKAGGYALQGKASVFITSVVGSPSNVIGLPLTETIELLRAAGVSLPMDRS